MNEASKEERNGSRDPLWDSFSSLPLTDWTSGFRYTRKPVCPECVLEAPEPRDPRARVPTDWTGTGEGVGGPPGSGQVHRSRPEGLDGHWLHPTHSDAGACPGCHAQLWPGLITPRAQLSALLPPIFTCHADVCWPLGLSPPGPVTQPHTLGLSPPAPLQIPVPVPTFQLASGQLLLGSQDVTHPCDLCMDEAHYTPESPHAEPQSHITRSPAPHLAFVAAPHGHPQ